MAASAANPNVMKLSPEQEQKLLSKEVSGSFSHLDTNSGASLGR